MTRRALSFLLLLLAALSSFAAPNPTPQNLDFESGVPGAVPPGWFAPTAAFGYATELTVDSPKQGKQCVRVSGAPQPMQSGQPGFGNVMQTIDATPYRGKRVRLRGAVRAETKNGAAGLWMRVDRANQQLGFFDNMGDRPIVARDWRYYEIVGDVAADAEKLNIGMLLRGEGTAWLDDVTIEATDAEIRAGKPSAVSGRGLENLVAFTRLFGIVRHFHASDEAASADWEAVAVNAIDSVESAKDARELATRLEEVFLPLAPSLRVYATGTAAPKIAKPAGAEAIVAWEHNGFGYKQPQYSAYTSERVRRGVSEPAGRFPDPLKPFAIDLGGGVSASIPLAVFADASHTLPRATREPMPLSKASYTGDDRATRIADVVLLWNVIQHFYPYFDVVDVDWPAELRVALRAAGEDRDEAAFLRTLRRMIAAIDDGHGSVSHASTQMPLPLLWRVVDNALIVTAVDASVSGINVGDEITAIDDKPSLPLLAEAEQLVSGATPQWRRWTALRTLGAGPIGSSSTLTVRGADGATRTVSVARSPRMEPLSEKRPEKIAEVKPGIWYVDLGRITDADFDASLQKLAAARGIVFDLRGYPKTGTKPLLHMIDRLTQSARWIVPALRRPDRIDAEWKDRTRWQLTPVEPRLPRNIAFLTDGRAISYAESWMGIIEAYKLAQIVGEPTAGTNGNINMFQLPGDYRVVFTGMRVLKHDGSRHHGVGIAPTVPVSPTIAGIHAGRDEQLEKAIAVLEK